MKKRLIRYLATILAIVMLVATPITAFAASADAQNAAEKLSELGLFKGTGKGYDLDREPTRQEAVVMLVRLLGKEADAKSETWVHPFNDVANWASPYVGYAYAKGYVNGISTTAFGATDLVSAAQYLTFVLRALGYDSGADFQWNEAWKFSDQIGLTNGEYNASSKFLRGDVAIISYNALSTENTGGEKLINILVNEGVVNKEISSNIGVYDNTAIEGVTSIRVSIVKMGDKYYLMRHSDGFTYSYTTVNNETLLFSDDIMVNDYGESTSWFLNYILRLAFLEEYTIEDTENPNVDGILVIQKPSVILDDFSGVITAGRDEPQYISAVETYTPEWIEYNGIRIYSLKDKQYGFQTIGGIRYYDNLICVNDILDLWGIDKTIEVGLYQETYYIEVI